MLLTLHTHQHERRALHHQWNPSEQWRASEARVGLLMCPLGAGSRRPLLLLLGMHLLLSLRPRRCSPWRQSHSVEYA